MAPQDARQSFTQPKCNMCLHVRQAHMGVSHVTCSRQIVQLYWPLSSEASTASCTWASAAEANAAPLSRPPFRRRLPLSRGAALPLVTWGETRGGVAEAEGGSEPPFFPRRRRRLPDPSP